LFVTVTVADFFIQLMETVTSNEAKTIS